MKRKSKAPSAYHHGDLRRALIDAAVAILSEEQNWGFSLREVARRAGVSHNAPYNHFPEKRDLLDAVAAVGFDMLRDNMNATMAHARDADVAMIDIARAYIEFATRNPALYRLMFGPELAQSESYRPDLSKAAGADAQKVLRDVIQRSCDERRVPMPEGDEASATAVLAAWSIVHGLAMLLIDGKFETTTRPEDMADSVMNQLLSGLHGRSEARPKLDIGQRTPK